MKVFIGVASGDQQYVGSLHSCYALKKEPDDDMSVQSTSRGDVSREALLDYFQEHTEYDAILMLDADHKHPSDLLERLRKRMEEGGLDMVCGHYYKRTTSPVQSLCYELGDGTWPFIPMLDPPTEGLHEIASTGMGCVLIHRRVIDGVQALLGKDESPFAIGPMPDVTGDFANFGTDFRFFILARRAGFRLWLDASLESPHATVIYLAHKSARRLMDYIRWADLHHGLLIKRLELHGVNAEAFRQRRRILEARQRGFIHQFEQAKEAWPNDNGKRDELSASLYEMSGRLKEMDAWIEWAEKYPPIARARDLPTTANTPPQEGLLPENETQAQREEGYKEHSLDLVGELPDVSATARPDGGNGIGKDVGRRG